MCAVGSIHCPITILVYSFLSDDSVTNQGSMCLISRLIPRGGRRIVTNKVLDKLSLYSKVVIDIIA